MYNPSSDDKVMQCPYNKYHIMASSSFQRHLVRCEKNYGPNYKVICPYNATHRLSKSEIAEHVMTCPTRKIIEASYIEQQCVPGSSKQKDESSFVSTVEDSWEEPMRASNCIPKFSHDSRNDESDDERDDVESLPNSSIGFGRGRRYSEIPIRLRFLKKGYSS